MTRSDGRHVATGVRRILDNAASGGTAPGNGTSATPPTSPRPDGWRSPRPTARLTSGPTQPDPTQHTTAPPLTSVGGGVFALPSHRRRVPSPRSLPVSVLGAYFAVVRTGNETAPIITEGRQPTGPSRWGCAVRIPPMPSPLPRRTLADWTPEAGDVTEWLARWEAAGWRVEAGPADTVVNGRALRRWAMIEQVSPSGGPT